MFVHVYAVYNIYTVLLRIYDLHTLHFHRSEPGPVAMQIRNFIAHDQPKRSLKGRCVH